MNRHKMSESTAQQSFRSEGGDVSPRCKVVHLTSVHSAGDARILHKECSTLAAAGYEVALVVPHATDDLVNGVRVRGLPIPETRRQRMLQTMLHVCWTALDEDAAVYHIHDPELLPVGFFLKLFRKRVIYDIHEDFPKQMLSKAYLPPSTRTMMARIVAGIERAASAAFDGMVAATPSIAERFPTEKTHVVQNFAVAAEFAPHAQVPYSQRPALVTYIGGISEARGIRETLAAMSLLPARLEAKLVLAGLFWSPELEESCKQDAAWKHVEFLGWRQRADIARLLGTARVGLVVLHPTPEYIDSQPTKLYEYMSAGLPVVASDFPVCRAIVDRHKCGLLVDPKDANAIRDAIQWLLEHPAEAEAMGQRGREAMKKHFNWDIEAEKLLSLYASLAQLRKA